MQQDAPPRYLKADEVIELFARVASRRDHLALVDQRTIRWHFRHKAVRDAARDAWRRLKPVEPSADQP
jgi:hypothetical protein